MRFARSLRWALLAIGLCGVIGVVFAWTNGLRRWGTPPDPNDPRVAGNSPEYLRRMLKGASDSLLKREMSGEIGDQEYHKLVARAANDLLDQVKVGPIAPDKAWEWGELYIAARRWPSARAALEIAVKSPRDPNRQVNDTLRLARVLAEMGQVRESVEVARRVLGVPDNAAAPILPATLLEIVPAGAGKGADPALAKLLEDAIGAEMRTIVDPNTDAGKAFLMARPIHVEHAWAKVIELYRGAGETQAAEAAQVRGVAMLRGMARL